MCFGWASSQLGIRIISGSDLLLLSDEVVRAGS